MSVRPQRPLRHRRRIPPAGAAGFAIVAFWLVIARSVRPSRRTASGAIVSTEVFEPISRSFPLGSDYLGRDMLSRILIGARYTVGVALLATALAAFTGVDARPLRRGQGRLGRRRPEPVARCRELDAEPAVRPRRRRGGRLVDPASWC